MVDGRRLSVKPRWPNEALIDYFIARAASGSESADPLEDERLAIVTRKDQPLRLYDLGDPRRIIPAARETRMANLRSTRSRRARRRDIDRSERHIHWPSQSDRAVETGRLAAPTRFSVPDGNRFRCHSLLQDGGRVARHLSSCMLTRPNR